jgi:RimJ/RimL family protein N-acetyltransferase
VTAATTANAALGGFVSTGMLASFTTRSVLNDGRPVTVRPIQPWEAHLVDEVFERMSPQSRYARFLAPVPGMTSSIRKALADVDHARHSAYVAEVDGTVAGTGRFVRFTNDPDRAELAFEIADDFQGLGVGTLLLHVLLSAARRAAVARLECTVAPNNRRAIALSKKIPSAFWRWEDGLIVGTAQLAA